MWHKQDLRITYKRRVPHNDFHNNVAEQKIL